jgi:succinate--hydroxymethylglutarate CoA-transferase
MLAYPVKFEGADLPVPAKAPGVGQHTDEVLTRVAGYDADKVAQLRADGVVN